MAFVGHAQKLGATGGQRGINDFAGLRAHRIFLADRHQRRALDVAELRREGIAVQTLQHACHMRDPLGFTADLLAGVLAVDRACESVVIIQHTPVNAASLLRLTGLR